MQSTNIQDWSNRAGEETSCSLNDNVNPVNPLGKGIQKSFPSHLLEQIVESSANQNSIFCSNKDFWSKADKLLSTTCTPKEDSPFFHTDLCIFPDDYQGLLPLNGIREKSYHKAVALFESISNDHTILKIEGDAQFRDLILISVKILLTKKIGRQFFHKLLLRPEKISIRKADANSGEESCQIKNVISLDTDSTVFVYTREPETGKLSLLEQPLFLSLAHELIHEFYDDHLDDDLFQEPTIGKDFTNIAEQRTITGFKSELPVFKTEATPGPLTKFLNMVSLFNNSATTVEEDFSSKKPIEFFYFNENAFRSVFAIPFRANHQGRTTIKKPSTFVVNNHCLTPELERYLTDLVSFGYKFGLEEAISKGLDVNARTRRGSTLLEVAVWSVTSLGKKWDPEVADLLIENGADVNPIDAEGNSLLGKISQFAVAREEVTLYLRSKGAQLGVEELSFETEDNVTDLMRTMSFCDSISVTIDMEKYNPLKINNKGFSALVYCIKSVERGYKTIQILRTLECYIANLSNEQVSEVLGFLSGYGKQTFVEWLVANKAKISQKITPNLYKIVMDQEKK